MDHLLLLRLMVLLAVANGAPIIATKLLGARLAAPLDGGVRLRDGARLFGASKTVRGVVASVGCSALVAPLLGFDWEVGAGFAAASLAGDLLSSFLKRRLKLERMPRRSAWIKFPRRCCRCCSSRRGSV